MHKYTAPGSWQPQLNLINISALKKHLSDRMGPTQDSRVNAYAVLWSSGARVKLTSGAVRGMQPFITTNDPVIIQVQ